MIHHEGGLSYIWDAVFRGPRLVGVASSAGTPTTFSPVSPLRFGILHGTIHYSISGFEFPPAAWRLCALPTHQHEEGNHRTRGKLVYGEARVRGLPSCRRWMGGVRSRHAAGGNSKPDIEECIVPCRIPNRRGKTGEKVKGVPADDETPINLGP